MKKTIIQTKNLSRDFKVPIRNKGIKEAFKSLFNREFNIVQAVKSIDLEIKEGEIIAFLGPNGAGKTTTLKMLSGLIYPTSGEIDVAGFIPYRREKTFLKSISLLMGNRRRLNWDIPVMDSFELYKEIFEINDESYKINLKELVDLMNIDDLLNRPVRSLSLGQRMKCELVLSLIHQPKIMFLDEPTIGLDITAQRNIREFIKNYNKLYNATIMITSHNMNDIETLCNRVIIINKGQIIFEGTIKELITISSEEKIINIEIKDKSIDLSEYGKIKNELKGKVEIIVAKKDVVSIVGKLLKKINISDIDIKDPPIEDIIEKIFKKEK